MKFARPATIVFTVFLFCCIACSEKALQADIFLVGAQMFHANSATGANIGGGYRFTTNSGDIGSSSFPLDFDGDSIGTVSRDISFLLAPGENLFEFDIDVFARNAYGLMLFFDSTGVPLVQDNTASLTADLSAFSTAGSGTLAVPAAGTLIQGYGSFNSVSYGGATVFAIGNDEEVSITGVNISNIDGGPTGSFTLTYVVPEPSTGTVWALFFLSTVVFTRRFRKELASSTLSNRTRAPTTT